MNEQALESKWQKTLLDAVQYCDVTRDHVAEVYAACIRYDESGTDWSKVNRAIMDRWSESALVYIKRKAWKHV